MNFCPKCRKKLVVQDFCVECGADLSEYLNNDSPSDSFGSFDFSALQDASEKLMEQSGLVIENGILVGYTGKKTSVYIPSTVEEIFDKAFYENSIITDISIENGANVIGKYAFYNCRYLKKIKIPKSVNQIGENAFYGVWLDCLMLDEFNENTIKLFLSLNAQNYLKTGANIKSYITNENGEITVRIKDIENQAAAYFNELKRKEEEEKQRQLEEQRKKYALLMADIGKIWTFGSYYVNSDSQKEPLEWIVVARTEGYAMLVSKNAIAVKKYNETDERCYFGTCTLRKWLVNDFLNSAFSSSEKERMLTVQEAGEKTNFDSSFGRYSDTLNDKIFLLTKENVYKYLRTNEQIQCNTTPYAIRTYFRSDERLVSYANGYDKYAPTHWWLNAVAYKGFYNSYATDYVKHDGRISLVIDNGGSSVSSENGVRPAIWISV